MTKTALAALAALLVTSLVAAHAIAEPRIAKSFEPGQGPLVAVAWDPITGNLFVYPDFNSEILEYTDQGDQVAAIPVSGNHSNDFDLDFAESSLNVGGVQVEEGTLLTVNGDSGPPTMYAVNEIDGTILGEVPVPGAAVGMAHNPASNTVFLADWTSDAVIEIDPATGTQLAAFSMAPAGSPTIDDRAFGIFYGDLDVHPTSGNLFVAGSEFNVIRELTPTGAFVRDIDLAPLGVDNTIAGIAFDDAGNLWVTGTDGIVVQVAGLLEGSAPPRCEKPGAICTGSEDDDVQGTSDNDFIFTAAGNDTIDAGAGDDTVDAGAGDDEVAAGQGADRVRGGDGRDRIWGDAATVPSRAQAVGGSDDVLAGDAGGDFIFGEAGDDLLEGGGGNDVLRGGPGVDIIKGGPGKDTCYGDKRDKFRSCEKLRRHI